MESRWQKILIDVAHDIGRIAKALEKIAADAEVEQSDRPITGFTRDGEN